MARVLSVGSINADFQLRVERCPVAGESLLAEEGRRLGGGKAANVARLVRALGVEVSLFGHVGGDELAEQALAPLREQGVDLSGVQRIAGAETGIAVVMVPPDGRKSIVVLPNANLAWTAGESAALGRRLTVAPVGAWLVLDCGIAAPAIEEALRAARRRRIGILLDPAPPEAVSDALLAAADMVLPNAGEARVLSGIEVVDASSAEQAGWRLLARGAGAACIKLPEGGCVLVEPEGVTRVGSAPVPVVDTTGAGDAFAAVLAAALARDLPLPQAIRLATAASHLAVTVFGAQAFLPSWEQLQGMAKRLELVSHPCETD